jgi:hypothetical protein
MNARSQAANLQLAPIDPADEGVSDYSGPLLSDLDFAAFSKSALVRIADEVCLQMALLDNSFVIAVDAREETADETLSIRRKQFTGFAGIAAYRLARALELPATEAAALRLLALHPALNPAAYVIADVSDDAIVLHRSPAHDDQAWISLCGPDWLDGLRAIVRALDPHVDVEAERAGAHSWRLRVVRRDETAPEAQEVAVAKFSTGTDFAFQPRKSLPISPA